MNRGTSLEIGGAKLWRDSQVSMNFSSTHISFGDEQRFKLQSIYWPEQHNNMGPVRRKIKSSIQEVAEKVSQKIDEDLKNDIRMKSRREQSKPKINFTPVLHFKSKNFLLAPKTAEITSRLTSPVKKQSKLRDRFGFRSNLFEDPENSSLLHKLNKTTGFMTSERVKLELPFNYYPGPGSYQIKRYLQSHRPSTTRAK